MAIRVPWRPTVVVGVLVAIGLGAVSLVSPGLVGSNFHTVVTGRVYRSARLTAAQLNDTIDRHGIRTVINLLGAEPGRAWYDAEVATVRRRGVGLRSLDLSSTRLPSRRAVVQLLEWLETEPLPVLVHCNVGSDRSGFASVLARIVLEGVALRQARAELSLAYGHLPVGPSTELDRFFDLYGRHLDESGEPDAAATLKRWVRRHYVPYVYSARIDVQAFPRVVTPGGPLPAVLRITNRSPGAWELSSDPDAGIKLGFRIRRDGMARWRDFDRAIGSGGLLAPGESREIRSTLRAPQEPGRYRVKIDMVDEHVTWFEDQGSRPVVLPLTVE